LSDAASAAVIEVRDRAGTRWLAFRGHLDTIRAGTIWLSALRAAEEARDRALVLELSGLTGCDTGGATLLLAIGQAHGGVASVEGATPQVSALLDRLRAVPRAEPNPAQSRPITLVALVRPALDAFGTGVAFLGEALIAVLRLPARRRMLRLADLLRTADHAGVRAIPLVLLLGALMGLILAFQSLAQLRYYGADIYVVNLVAISLLRELGPLLAAVVLAGRTGSAFAAEIGTMKVNEEIDALITLGIDPMTNLVLPRLGAALLVTPALTLALEFAGLFGMGVVLVASGIPPVAIVGQIERYVRPGDFYQGLVKAAVFGGMVAGIGCRAGLATGEGPRAVGLSATAAVVGGIVATVAMDGVFALVFYQLGI
jgi:phospholipid/cholesterol/gamma-HCH transport system permease protein